MKIKTTIYPLMLCVLFAACKKSTTENVHFPQKLYYTSLVQKTDMRMFTANGQITDTSKINHFLGAQKSFVTITNKGDDTTSLVFKSADTVFFPGDSNPMSVKKNGSQLLLYSGEILVESNPSDLDQGILKYPYLVTPIDATSGYTGEVRGVEVAYGDYSSLSVSVMCYKVFQGTYPQSYEIEAGIILNEFNESFISKLGATDTIAVQEFSEVYTAH